MNEHTLWHPVALAAAVTQAPLAAQLMETDLVLWRDDAGTVHAWADQCPHRGARFSLGRVEGGTLECPYHGWRFAPGGQCVAVPALPDFTPPASNRARTYGVREAHGLIWVRLAGDGEADGESAPALPAFTAEDDPRLRKLDCGPYDVAASAPRIVENFLDMAHFGFVHEGWLGAREYASVDDYRVEATPTGILATSCRAWQPQSSPHATGPAQVDYTYEVTAPYTALLTKVPDAATVPLADFREAIGLFICPLTPETSRVWFRLAVADFTTPDEQLRAFQHTIFTQDQPVLESQRPKRLPLDVRAELHTAADRASAAYRRFLRQAGIGYGTC